LIGDSGTGKSHLLIALGTETAMHECRVKYVLATELVNELAEAADEKLLAKTIARYGRVDLLCIDELGYMELDRRGVELLFQVLTEREEKNSVAIASNESFGGWTKTFTDPRFCALPTCWPPSPCTHLSCTRTTTRPPPHPTAHSRQRTCPSAKPAARREGRPQVAPTFTGSSIGQIGAQLYPDSIATPTP
jgi:hypothetical protein